MNKMAWKFVLDGVHNILEVEINDFTGKVKFILNGYIYHTAKVNSIFNWQNISFKIKEHKCNFIYTTGLPFHLESQQFYDLIVDGYSIVTGELFDFTTQKQKYLKKYYMHFFRTVIGVAIGGFFSGYLLAYMSKGLIKSLLETVIIIIGYYIGVKSFDIFYYIFRRIRKSNYTTGN